MGGCFMREPDVDFNGPVDFNHFHILRAIGKGAFGKVCIVKKKDTKEMYAMKYMNKVQIIRKHAVDNVFREVEILRQLEHPFIVNLWFTFQDQEDIFMVLDLMLGGDISYHLEKQGRFAVARVRLYVAELSLALEYLRDHNVIHRDVKPANMLLDSGGHVHLTDFNVATIVRPGVPITSVTGTKPYMAPEVLNSHSSTGYSYAVDWWGLGVSAYEMLRGQRPFSIDRHMTNEEIVSNIRHSRPSASVRWDHQTCDLLKMLLHPDECKRLQSLEGMRQHRFFEETDWDQVERKEITPLYIPAQNRIHCDPTHELEEMIVEPNPLHKKQYRLSRRNFRVEDETILEELEKMERRFSQYNRLKLKEAQQRSADDADADGQVRESTSGADDDRGNLEDRNPETDNHTRASGSVRDSKRTASLISKESSTPVTKAEGESEQGSALPTAAGAAGSNSDSTEAAAIVSGGSGSIEGERASDAQQEKNELTGGGVGGVGGEEREVGERETVEVVSLETDSPVVDVLSDSGPTENTTAPATSEQQSGVKLQRLTAADNQVSEEAAPAVSGSSSDNRVSPAHSSDDATATQDSPTQIESPNPVERTDSMNSAALLIPKET